MTTTTKSHWDKQAIDPLTDRVVVLPIDNEGTTRGGIVLPDNMKDKPRRGRVLAVGPGKYDHGAFIEPPVVVDDIVIYVPFKGVDVMHEGTTLKVIANEDLLAVIRDVDR